MPHNNKPSHQGEALTPGAIATMREMGWTEAQIDAVRQNAERIKAAGGFQQFVHKAEAARIMAEATGVQVEPEHIERTPYADAAALLAEQSKNEETASPPAWWCYLLALELVQRNGWAEPQRAAAEGQFMETLEAAADALTLLRYPSLEPWPKGQPLPPRWREGLFVRKADLRTWATQHAPHWLGSSLLAEPVQAGEAATIAEPVKTGHSTKSKRTQPLSADIEAAKLEATNPGDVHSVYAVLQRWAEAKKAPFIGFAEGEGCKYQTPAGAVAFFTLDALRKRMSRAGNGR